MPLSHIARVYTDFVRARVYRADCKAVIEVYVGYKGHVDKLAHFGKSRYRLHVGHGNAHHVATCVFKRVYLAERCGNVLYGNVGHGLYRNAAVAHY